MLFKNIRRIGRLVLCGTGFFLLFGVAANQLFFRVTVPTSSMYPAIYAEEQLLIRRGNNNLKRGDIVVFYSAEERRYLIKRILGLPGEEILIRNGWVYVDNEIQPEPYIENRDRYDGTFFVPREHYFLMGDNRTDSQDSRYWENTYIERKSIKGKIFLHLSPKLKIHNDI